MNNDSIREQAATLNTLVSKVMRRINMLEAEDPIIELPIAQMRVCFVLLDSPKTMSNLSKELGISLSAVTQLANRLEKANLVERHVEPDDLRVKMMQLSPHGEKLMRARREQRIERLIKMLECMQAEDRSLITQAFQKLYDTSIMIDHGSKPNVLPIVEQILDS